LQYSPNEAQYTHTRPHTHTHPHMYMHDMHRRQNSAWGGVNKNSHVLTQSSVVPGCNSPVQSVS